MHWWPLTPWDELVETNLTMAPAVGGCAPVASVLASSYRPGLPWAPRVGSSVQVVSEPTSVSRAMGWGP